MYLFLNFLFKETSFKKQNLAGKDNNRTDEEMSKHYNKSS
jgi:hypothetical protein